MPDLLAYGIVGRVSHGTAHLPSSQRYHLTVHGIRESDWALGFDTPSDFVRAYPMSREWKLRASELERKYQKEVAEHRETKGVLGATRV